MNQNFLSLTNLIITLQIQFITSFSYYTKAYYYDSKCTSLKYTESFIAGACIPNDDGTGLYNSYTLTNSNNNYITLNYNSFYTTPDCRNTVKSANNNMQYIILSVQCSPVVNQTYYYKAYYSGNPLSSASSGTAIL